MKVIKVILTAAGAVLSYCLIGWLALYLCVLIGIWGVVPDMVIILVFIFFMTWFWDRFGVELGRVRLALVLFLVPALVWGAVFGILQYLGTYKDLETGWLAGLPIVLEGLSAFICAGLVGVIFLVILWLQKRKGENK